MPDDYVIGTGEAHSVEEFVDEAFRYVGLEQRKYVLIEPAYFRPTEVPDLRADSSKARKRLNWTPRVNFHDLVKIMIDADLEMLGMDSPGAGKKITRDKGFHWLTKGPCS